MNNRRRLNVNGSRFLHHLLSSRNRCSIERFDGKLSVLSELVGDISTARSDSQHTGRYSYLLDASSTSSSVSSIITCRLGRRYWTANTPTHTFDTVVSEKGVCLFKSRHGISPHTILLHVVIRDASAATSCIIDRFTPRLRRISV